MKTIFTTVAAIITMYCMTATTQAQTTSDGMYCAKMNSGKTTILHNGSPIMTDVTLSNGVIIKSDGTVTRKDGTIIVVKEGQCLDKTGQLATANRESNTRDIDKKQQDPMNPDKQTSPDNNKNSTMPNSNSTTSPNNQ